MFLPSPLLAPPPREVRNALGLGVVVALSAAVLPYLSQGVAAPTRANAQQPAGLLPATAPPLLLRDVKKEDAPGINAAIALTPGPNPAARPFAMPGGEAAYNRALTCLTEAIYYEASGEPADGQRAVAQVVLNRVRHPAFSPDVCAVVYHGAMRTTGCQFSFTCDGSLHRRPTAHGWARARGIAEQALAGTVFEPVGYATHYHADYVVPYWATSLAKTAVLGAHIFYRWPGWWGQPPAFARRVFGNEIESWKLRLAAVRRAGVREASWDGNLALEPDRRVELISIVQMLAARRRPGKDATAYETAVHKHFSPFEDHLAVEIYRQLAAGNSKFTVESSLQALMQYSPPPMLEPSQPLDRDLIKAAGGPGKLAGLISALRGFAEHTHFETFFNAKKPLFDEITKRARPPALALAGKVQRDTGAQVDSVRLIVAPLLSTSGIGGCEAASKSASIPWVTIGLGAASRQPFEKPTQIEARLASLVDGPCPGSARGGGGKRRV